MLDSRLGHRAVVSSFGCPFHCTYCASRRLAPEFFRRPPNAVASEIRLWFEKGIRDFAFYDDALLYQQEKHLSPILALLEEWNVRVRFHTPNGMHARWITLDTARMLFRNGFQTLRIGFETDILSDQVSTGGKVSNAEMEQAIVYLKEAGFRKHQIGIYLIVGLNGEPWQETIRRARWIQERGGRALPNFLSPVPATNDFARLSAQYPVLEEDPLSHNDLFFAFYSGTVGYAEFNILKRSMQEGNR